MGDYYSEQSAAASMGRNGADRMAAGLGICVDEERGDLDVVLQLRDEIARLREELRWIPVTEKLPPDDKCVDFLCMRGDGYGYRGISKEDCEKYGLEYDPIPKIYENETGPYFIGKYPNGEWGVTHWRLRPGTQPDFDKFIEENK